MSKKMDLIMKVQGLIDKSLPGNLKKIATEVKNLREARQKLEKAQKSLKAQKELNKEIMANVAHYKKLKNELKALEQIKKKNNGLTEAEKKKYESLTKKAKALENTIKSQSKSFHKYGMEIKKLKIPFDSLQSEIDQTINKEKQLIAQHKIAEKAQGVGKGIKDKVKTGMKVAAVATIGAAIGIGASSAKDYLEFDKQMVKVKALTGATNKEYEDLKNKAMEVGKTTIFTSEEAAAGMEKFALAGFKPKEIIAAIPPIFDLATASGEDFIMISDLISDHMSAFNIGIDDVGHASDILANTMSRSNTNIEMLGEAFKYVSASAHDLKIDLSTTSAAVGLMGDQAIKSGQAGRNLKQAFAKIADNDVQKKLKKLGVNVKDSKGEFVGLVDFVRQLDKATNKMTGIDKLGLLKDLFGDQGSLAVNKLLTATKEVNGVIYNGADALAQFAKENENATGKAKEMANTILGSDSGKWALVESAISDVKLKIGKAIFSGGGTQLMDTAINWLNELSNVLDGKFNATEANKFWQSFIENGKMALNSIKNIGIVLWNVFKVLNTIGIDNILVFVTVFTATSKVLKFAGAVKEVFTTVKAAGGIMSALKGGIAALGGPISLVIAAVALLGYIIYKNWDKIKAFFKEVWDVIKGIGSIIWGVFKAIIDGIIDLFKWLWEKIKTYFNNFGFLLLGPIGIFIKLGQLIYQNWDLIKEKLSSVWEYIKSIPEKVVEIVLEISSTIGNFLINLVSGIIEGIKNLFLNLWDTGVQFLGSLGSLLATPIESFKNTIANVVEQIKLFFASPFEYIDNAISIAKEKAINFLKSIPGVDLLFGNKDKVETAKGKGIINGSHENGLSHVPFDGYIAELHEGERVLTKDENESIFGNLRNRIHNASQGTRSESTSKTANITYEINNTFSFTGVSEGTKDSIIKELQESLNELKRQLEKLKGERETYARTSL